MKRFLSLLAVLSLLIAVFPGRALALQQLLPELSHKYYPLRDVVFVDFHNPYFAPIDTIVVNMVIREGTGRNRIVAIGQVSLPPTLVLSPGEHASAKVPIRARVLRDIPALAQFEFRITGRQLTDGKAPPDVVLQDSPNGSTLEFNRDPDGVPMVLGFIQLNPSITTETTVTVQAAILTFYDSEHTVVWSETMPIGGRLTNNDSLMIWGKFDQIRRDLVPDLSSVDVKFVVTPGK
ncbi:MAG TPA: hypothetical protein VD969_11775 [Symbiobacteriaceae bacterium]|nr:hypothetical protein [Symbiobacteriaceae bacterium]